MKNSLWLVIVIVAASLGFLMGYTLPPLVEVGMIGGSGEQPGTQTEVSKEMQDYYNDLLEE